MATGILRTVDAASPVAAGAVLSSLLLFIAVYAIVFAAGIYYINRLLEKGPPVLEDGADETPLGTTLSSASSAARAATEEA